MHQSFQDRMIKKPDTIGCNLHWLNPLLSCHPKLQCFACAINELHGNCFSQFLGTTNFLPSSSNKKICPKHADLKSPICILSFSPWAFV